VRSWEVSNRDGIIIEDSCILCSSGTYQTGDGMRNESSCRTCGAGKYFSGLGNPSAENCTSGLSPMLKQQAQATTAVVSTVMAIVVSTSAAGAIGAAVGGSVASSGGSGGASIFQLIQATQFMNIFGKLFTTDQKTAQINSERRISEESDGSAISTAGYDGESSEASEFRCVLQRNKRS
jgi:hypothetical protein